MSLSDAFSSRFAGPAGKVLDAPIRALVHEILREQGYASPAEVQALRDDTRDIATRLTRAETRLTEMAKGQDATLVELKDSRDALRSAQAESTAARAALAAAEAHISALESKLTAAPVVVAADPPPATKPTARPTVAAEPAPLIAAPKGTCAVPECTGTVRSKGFCSPHYQQWRRGSLQAFVGPEGHVSFGDASFQVSADYAGQLALVSGEALTIGGVVVPSQVVAGS